LLFLRGSLRQPSCKTKSRRKPAPTRVDLVQPLGCPQPHGAFPTPSLGKGLACGVKGRGEERDVNEDGTHQEKRRGDRAPADCLGTHATLSLPPPRGSILCFCIDPLALTSPSFSQKFGAKFRGALGNKKHVHLLWPGHVIFRPGRLVGASCGPHEISLGWRGHVGQSQVSIGVPRTLH
jgi:hypothetical protein